MDVFLPVFRRNLKDPEFSLASPEADLPPGGESNEPLVFFPSDSDMASTRRKKNQASVQSVTMTANFDIQSSCITPF